MSRIGRRAAPPMGNARRGCSKRPSQRLLLPTTLQNDTPLRARGAKRKPKTLHPLAVEKLRREQIQTRIAGSGTSHHSGQRKQLEASRRSESASQYRQKPVVLAA